MYMYAGLFEGMAAHLTLNFKGKLQPSLDLPTLPQLTSPKHWATLLCQFIVKSHL